MDAIVSLFLLASAATPDAAQARENAMRAQAIGHASVTIVAAERINARQVPSREQRQPSRQYRTREGTPMVEFY